MRHGPAAVKRHRMSRLQGHRLQRFASVTFQRMTIKRCDLHHFLPLVGVLWLQQKLNPAPTDPTQQMIFAWMPWVFMFMLGSFASGLVVYWIANNTITFTQQYLIMRSQGYKPDLLGNITGGFRRKSKDAANDSKGKK